MLSKQDYRDFLGQVGKLENDMVKFYADCASRVQDSSIREICLKISGEEKQHALIVEKLKSLFCS